MPGKRADVPLVTALALTSSLPGAVRMAGEACQRVGAGLIRVMTHEDSTMAVAIGRPELMVEAVDEVEVRGPASPLRRCPRACIFCEMRTLKLSMLAAAAACGGW